MLLPDSLRNHPRILSQVRPGEKCTISVIKRSSKRPEPVWKSSRLIIVVGADPKGKPSFCPQLEPCYTNRWT